MANSRNIPGCDYDNRIHYHPERALSRVECLADHSNFGFSSNSCVSSSLVGRSPIDDLSKWVRGEEEY
jgi:hypothetical protein